MTYPKTRITRSRSRNMRKKHLVKSKSKRINRSRKSNKNHSRKYRGGDPAVTAEYIQDIIDGNIVTEIPVGTELEKVSSIYNPSITIDNFLRESRPHEPPTFLGYCDRGGRTHLLYRSKNNHTFLVIVYNTVRFDNGEYFIKPNTNKDPIVYHFEPWMFAAIIVEEIGYQNEEERIQKEEQEERRIIEEGLFSTM